MNISKLRKEAQLFLKKVNFELLDNSKKNDDIYSLGILQSLLVGYQYLPLNGGALRPYAIAYVLNEIIINNRRKILEFGSGLSTILMARLLKKNSIDAKIISVEHNRDWSEKINKILIQEDLSKFVTIIQSDLEITNNELGEIYWYGKKGILENIDGHLNFDLILIDGPPANSPNIKLSRAPAFDLIEGKLNSDFCIILDDANRAGEKIILDWYLKKSPSLNFSIVAKTFAVIRSKDFFNPIPMYYSK